MTTVLKLGIQGIRSFGEQQLECITFDSPVTLIVGPNGSGKTTIIECLKFASAGLLPPNCNHGRFFVHDPKIANVPEIKGQIRMLFKQSNGTEILAIRSCQLTRSKTAKKGPTLTYKALECVLKTGSGADRQSLSHRCADMDVKVPLLMGVSQAILENVIFCHQEEATWPLQDQAVLKKKFDAIFGATRYTKALKNIGEIKVDWAKKQKEKKGTADTLSVHVDHAKSLRKRDTVLLEKKEIQKKQLEELESEIAIAEKKQADAQRKQEQLSQLASQQETLKSMENHCREQREKIHLPEILNMELPELLGLVERMESAKNAHIREKDEENRNLREMDAEYDKMVKGVNQARDAYSQLAVAPEIIASRKQQLQKLWTESGMFRGDYQGRSSLAQVAAYVHNEEQALQLNFQKKEAEMKTLKERVKTFEAEKNTRTKAYHEACAKYTELENNIKRVTTELNSHEYRGIEQDLEHIRAEIRSSDDVITVSKECEQLSLKINEIAKQMHNLQFAIDEKTKIVQNLELQSRELNEIDVLRNQAREADDKVAKHKNSAPSTPIPVDTENFTGLKGRVSNWLLDQERLLDEKRRHAQQAHNKVSALEAEQQCAQDEAVQLRKEIEDKERQVGKMTVEEADANLATARANHADTVFESEGGKAGYELLSRFLKSNKKTNCCQMCSRGFADENEKTAMINSIQRHQQKVASNAQGASLDQAKDAAETEVTRRQEDRSVVIALQALHEQLKTVIRRGESIAESLREAKRVADQAVQEVEPLSNRIIAVKESWQKFADDLERMEQEALAAHKKASDRAERLVIPEGGSLAEEREALTRLTEEREVLGRRLESKRIDERATSERKNKLEMQKRDRLAKESRINQVVERKKKQSLELGKYESELAAQKTLKQNATNACAEAEKNYKQMSEAYTVRVAELSAHFTKQEDKVRDAQAFKSDMNKCQDELELLEEKQRKAQGERARIVQLDHAAENAKTKVNRLKQKVDDVTSQLAELAAKIDTGRKNIEVKHIEAQLTQYCIEKQKIAQQIGAISVDGLLKAVKESTDEVGMLKERRGHFTGAMDENARESAAIQEELKITMYDDIDEKYRFAVLDNELSLIIIQDLTKYHAALDRALMKFHASKMTDINKLVRDMWRQVYRGSDIEYIQIRSDADTDIVGPTTGSGSRSHNYRVVMINAHNNSELEMRGRCSAGQKVLASLIIRLALADAFGCQCGILSLDEPTTNLDSHNIEALAQALGELIRARSVHEGFQLMIITHDETFVGMLARQQVCDRYWRVSKNHNGHSVIMTDDIRRLMG
eukprot:GEMP01004037.1.p1 GENE.GEMP01004037.1~~GEMP01004037.1.p1  ORF type:complete len:1304 (+),score=363.45 GEMP01004037.1:19-3930(+)